MRAVLITFLLAGYASCQCPTSDWKYDETTNACFLPVLTNLTYSAALQNCVSQNATLVNLKTSSYNSVADTIVIYDEQNVEWWSGGKRANSNSHFLWTDGTGLGYTRWMPLYPNKVSGHDCIAIHMINQLIGGWQNEDCTAKKPSICVIENAAPLPTENTSECPKTPFHSATGSMTSPGWPDNYPNLADCHYFIKVATGHKVNFTLSFFETEACCDWLYIHDGPLVSSPIIASLRGIVANGTSYVSTGNALTLRFTSDESTNDKGFYATYRTV